MWNALSIAALAALASSPAGAQPRPVTIIVAFAPGGGADFVAQRLAETLPALLGARVVLSHRPGEDGLVAAEEAMRAPADGYTLLLGSTASLVHAPLAQNRMPIDPVEDFEPVAMVASAPRLVVVHPSLDAKNLDQLIRLARDQPGKLTCGTADQFSQHAVRLFERQAGVKLDCAHFDGAAMLREELVSGRRKIAFESAFLPEVQAGHLRAIAVAGPSRMRPLPDVPTTSEAGLPGVEAVIWQVVVAPKGTDRARVETLASAIDAALKQPAFVQSLESRGFVVRPMSRAQMRTLLQRDMQTWRRAS